MTTLTADQIEEADLGAYKAGDLRTLLLAARTYAALLRDVESGRKVIVDRLCQTCEGTGSRWDDDCYACSCPDCTDGLVPYIALTKQGGEWAEKAIRAVGYHEQELDALAEASEEGE